MAPIWILIGLAVVFFLIGFWYKLSQRPVRPEEPKPGSADPVVEGTCVCGRMKVCRDPACGRAPYDSDKHNRTRPPAAQPPLVRTSLLRCEYKKTELCTCWRTGAARYVGALCPVVESYRRPVFESPPPRNNTDTTDLLVAGAVGYVLGSHSHGSNPPEADIVAGGGESGGAGATGSWDTPSETAVSREPESAEPEQLSGPSESESSSSSDSSTSSDSSSTDNA